MNTEVLSKSLSFLGSWLQLRYERDYIPGFVVAVAHKGKVLFNQAYGYANVEKGEKLRTDHIFRIASHSKTFTATAIMKLVEEGKLCIDDCIVNHLSWLEKHPDNRISKMTIRQVLSHSSGIIRDGLDADFWDLERPFPTHDELKSEILKANLIFDTNTKVKYSNIGYGLLGMLIEAVSGKPYNEYVKANIVESLRLHNTGPEYVEQINDKLVTGYSRRDLNKSRQPITNINTNALSSATGFYSTAEDLCNYFAAQAIDSEQLLSAESKKEMQRTHWQIKNTKKNGEEYGLGFAIQYLSNRRFFGHYGGFPGQATVTFCDPEEKLVIVVLTNCIDADTYAMANGIFSVIDYFQKNNSSADSLPDLAKYQGRFMRLWSLMDIIVIGKKIVSIRPDGWSPFDMVEELEYVDHNTLKVIKAYEYASEGELVHFDFSVQGNIKSIRYCGKTMWTEKEYLKKIAVKSVIGGEK